MPLLTKDAFISSQDGKNDPTDSCNKSQTATTHLLIILFRFALISTFFSSLLMDLSCQAKEKYTASFKFSGPVVIILFGKGVSNSKLAIVLSPSASGLHVKLSVVKRAPFHRVPSYLNS